MTRALSMFSHILAATSRLDRPDPPAVTAARLARGENARLNLVHVVTSARIRGDIRWPPQDAPTGHDGAIPSFPMMARRLSTLYSGEFPDLCMADVHILSGVAWEAIFKSATALKSRLIVLGPHVEPSRAATLHRARSSLGSTADGVIRHAPCPVMLSNRRIAARRLRFNTIVVGIDFSRPCISALCLAVLLAERRNGCLHLFHMLPIPPYPKYTPESYTADRRRIEEQLKALSRQLLAKSSPSPTIHIVSGTIPHAALLRYAGESAADLIVIGSHTKEKSGKWYPGSVAQQLSFQTRCPVVVVNGPGALNPWRDDARVAGLSSMGIEPLTLFPG